LGGVFSLAGFWYTESPWVIQLRSNLIKTNNIDTYSTMVGVGYQLDYSSARGTSSEAGPPRVKTTDNEITVMMGQATVNSANSPQSLAQSIEYRRGIARYIDWTIAWLNEGENRLIRRNGILSQAWLVRAFLDEHLALGVGLGPYFLVDKFADEARYTVAGVITLSASYRFNPNWLVRLSWNRITTDYNRDTDVIMIGPGYRF
jgi:hypothetical protein